VAQQMWAGQPKQGGPAGNLGVGGALLTPCTFYLIPYPLPLPIPPLRAYNL